MTDDGYLKEEHGPVARFLRGLIEHAAALIGLVVGISVGIEFVGATKLPSHEFGSPSALLAIYALMTGGGIGLVGLVLLIPERTRGLGQGVLTALALAAVGWLVTAIVLPR